MPPYDPFENEFDPSVDVITADSHGLAILDKLEESTSLEGQIDPAELQMGRDKLLKNFRAYEDYKGQRGEDLFSYQPEVVARGKAKSDEENVRYTTNLYQAGPESFDTILKQNGDYDDFKRGASILPNGGQELEDAYKLRKTMQNFGFSDRMIDSGFAEPQIREMVKAQKDEPTKNALLRWSLDAQTNTEKRRELTKSAVQSATWDSAHMTGKGSDNFEKALNHPAAKYSDAERTYMRRAYNITKTQNDKTFSKVRQPVRKLFNTIMQLNNKSTPFTDGPEDEPYESYDAAVVELVKLPESEFGNFLAMTAQVAEAHGEDVDGVMNQLDRNFSRAVEELNQNIIGGVAEGGLSFAEGELQKNVERRKSPAFRAIQDVISKAMGVDPKDLEAQPKLFKAMRGEVEKVTAYQTAIANWRSVVADVTKGNSGNVVSDAILENFVYGVAASVPEMGAAAVGTPGMLLVTAAQYERNAASYRETTGEIDTGEAEEALWVSAYAYAALNRVQFKTATKAMPATSSLLKEFGKRTFFEAVQETGQDLSYATTLELYGAMDEDIKDVDLMAEVGDSIRRFPRTMMAVAPLTLAGMSGRGALNHYQERAFGRALKDKQLLEMYGMDPFSIEQVQTMTPAVAADFIQENNGVFVANMKGMEAPASGGTTADITFNAEKGEFKVANNGKVVTARTAEEAAEGAQMVDPEIQQRVDDELDIPEPDTVQETETLNSFFGPDLGWGKRSKEARIFGDERLPPTVPEGKDKVDRFAKARYGLQSILTQQILPSRTLSKTLLEAKNKIQGANAHFTRVANHLDNTVKKHLKNTPEVLRDAEGIKIQENTYLALRGDAAALAALPSDIGKQVESARADIDYYSQQLIDTDVVGGDLAKVVGDNIGSYIFRQFKAFDPKAKWGYNFVKNNEPAIYHAALKEIMLAGDLTRKEADLEIKELLQGGAQDFYHGKSAGGKIDVTSFIKKKDLSPVMLDLLGEVKNPITNIRETGGKVSKIAITHMGQMRMRQQLVEMGLVSDTKNQEAGHTQRLFEEVYPYPIVNEDGTAGIDHGKKTKKAYAGFNNAFMDPLIADAIERAFESKAKADLNARGLLGKVAAAMSAALKTNLVAFNPGSYMVNTFGGIATNIWNGHFFSTSPRGVAAYLKGLGTELADVVNKGKAPVMSMEQQNTALDKKNSEYGTADKVPDALKTEQMENGNILGSSVVANDIQRSVEVTAGDTADIVTAPFWKLYQVADNRAKRMAYEVELTKYMEAHPDETLRQASARAIEDVRGTTQNYDMVPKLIKEASTYGIFVPTFISFSVELLRNMKNTAKLTARELRSDNAVIRKAGAKRLAGQLAMIAAMTKGAEILTEFMTGEDEDDLKKLDVFKDPWDKRKNVIWTEAKDGRLTYFNPEYIIPQMAIYNALSSGFNNVSDGGVLNGVATAADVLGLTDDNIMMQTAVNILANKNNYGQEIYNATVDGFGTKTSKIGEHIRENAFTPGVVRSWDKWGKAKEETVGYAGSTLSGTEFAVYMAGIRLRVKDTTSERFLNDPMKQFAFTSRDISKSISKTELAAYEKDGTLGRKLSKLTPKEVIEEVRAVKAAKTGEEKQIKDLIDGFRYIGIDDRKIKKAMKEASVPSDLRKEATQYMRSTQ